MRKVLITVGTILALGIVLNFNNVLNKPKVQENITITTDSSGKLGSCVLQVKST